MPTDLDESERQRALDVYHVVDSFPETAYDDIVRLATQICDVPMAIVSLIDRDRQWFKASSGLAMSETTRDVAFCDHAICFPDQMLVVPDAVADPRFTTNPLVTGDLSIRFYAGMPLVTPGGAPIGTVCVLDREARVLSDGQRDGLASLARLTMNLLEARHRQRELERAVLFAAQAATGSPELDAAPVEPGLCTIAIFELQDISAAIKRLGERVTRRVMVQLEQLLHTGLRPKLHDSNHVSDSADLIVMLNGADTAATLQSLRDKVASFEREHDVRVLVGIAHSEEVNERLESIYLRADIALSEAKDTFRAA